MNTKRKAQNLRSRWGGRIPEEAIRVKLKGTFQQPFFSVSLAAYTELPETPEFTMTPSPHALLTSTMTQHRFVAPALLRNRKLWWLSACAAVGLTV